MDTLALSLTEVPKCEFIAEVKHNTFKFQYTVALVLKVLIPFLDQ